MNTLRKNTVANYGGRAWSVVSIYLFVPLYLKLLGTEAFGLVGFYSTLLGVLALADLGLTATLGREMARLEVHEDSAGEMGDLLRTYESIYLGLALALSAAIWFAAPYIAGRWLQASTLPPAQIASAIRLMGIAIMLQLLAHLYLGGLFGLQKQILANSFLIGWGILRGAGGVLVLWLVSPTILAFSFWQLFSNAVYCLAVRSRTWRALPARGGRPGIKGAVLSNTWAYALGVAGMSLLSTIQKQTDKLAVSKLMPLEIFGYYTLAGSLAMAPIALAGPIAAAVFPRMTGLISIADRGSLKRLYHRACALVSVAVLPAGLTLTAYSGPFLLAWTGSAAAVEKAGWVAAFLLGGSIVQAISIMPYNLALAHGNVSLNLRFLIVSVILITPLSIFLIARYGIIGGGISWLVMNLCILPPYMVILHRRFLPGELKTWILRDVGQPLLAAFPVILLSRWLLPLPSSRLIILATISLVGGLSALSAACIVPGFRKEIAVRTFRLFSLVHKRLKARQIS
jgi:O-antigen/teichoic acid export membrane protein